MSTKKIKGSEGWLVSLSLRRNGKRYRREQVAKGYFDEETQAWVKPQTHAKRLEAQLMKEIEEEARGVEPEPVDDVPTIHQLVARYFERYYITPSNSRSTMEARLKHFTTFCHSKGILYLHQFTEPYAKAYWAHLKATFKGKGPYGKWESASSLINFAIKIDSVMLRVNVLQSVPREAQTLTEEERWMDDDLVEALMSCAENQQEDARLCYNILLDCGLRRDELRMLPKTRIDLKTNQVRIAGHKDPKGRIWKPKTDRSTRWVPMSAKAVAAAMRLLAKYPDSYYLLPAMSGDTGDPRGENWLQMKFDELREITVRTYPRFRPVLHETIGDTGRFVITLHSFRHTLATRLLRGGMSIHMIGEVLGHSDAHITERYAKFAKSDLMEIASFLDRKYRSPQTGTDSGTARIIKMANSA